MDKEERQSRNWSVMPLDELLSFALSSAQQLFLWSRSIKTSFSCLQSALSVILQKDQSPTSKHSSSIYRQGQPNCHWNPAHLLVTKSIPCSCKWHLPHGNLPWQGRWWFVSWLQLDTDEGDLSLWLTIAGDPPSIPGCCLQMQNEVSVSMPACVPLWTESSASKTTLNALLTARVGFLKGSYSHPGWRNLPV